ncbi:MAG: hypothetical protein ACK5IJ_02080 [Mangrovibacterium sp.]
MKTFYIITIALLSSLFTFAQDNKETKMQWSKLSTENSYFIGRTTPHPQELEFLNRAKKNNIYKEGYHFVDQDLRDRRVDELVETVDPDIIPNDNIIVHITCSLSGRVFRVYFQINERKEPFQESEMEKYAALHDAIMEWTFPNIIAEPYSLSDGPYSLSDEEKDLYITLIGVGFNSPECDIAVQKRKNLKAKFSE